MRATIFIAFRACTSRGMRRLRSYQTVGADSLHASILVVGAEAVLQEFSGAGEPGGVA